MEKRKTRRLIQLSLSPEINAIVDRLAREQNRPIANLIHYALVLYLRELGELPSENEEDA